MCEKLRTRTSPTEDSTAWDPKIKRENEPIVLESALARIKKDLTILYKEPPPGIFVTANEADIREIHAIVVGPMDTPYEGGMFYFFLRCPYNYPLQSPMVKLMTTDAGKVRFNPNLYACGKVCLSIIGTWEGPGWTPAQQISTVLLSIQSIMNESPIKNAPGFEKFRYASIAADYNELLTYDTIRVAVIGMVENECSLNIPAELKPVIEMTFLHYFDVYVEICTRNSSKDGKPYMDSLHPTNTGVYNYKGLLDKLYELKKKLVEKQKRTKQPSSDGDGSDFTVVDKEEETVGKDIKMCDIIG